MFNSARRRSETNKIKGVFKLQFHGTQMALLGGDDLMISLVPDDVGKPTSRLEKAKVEDGSCYWEKPLYETVKFSQDPKTGKFHEKIYHFIVTKDASRFGDVGVVSIDFASYAEATKISSVSLPLQNANPAAVLHVSIQRLQDTSDQRDIDEIGNVNQQVVSLMTHFINDDIRRITEDYRTRNGVKSDHQASIGSDIMLSSFDNSFELNLLHEHGPKNPELAHKFLITNDSFWQRDRLKGSPPKLKTDDSSTTTLGETSEESSSDTMIQNLKVKVAALTRQADVSGLELQTLRKKIVKEMKKGQDISRKVATLREERNALKEECEKLKSKEDKVNGMPLIDQGDPYALLDELRQEIVHEKDLSSNLRLQLQETQKSNDELVLALKKSKSKSRSKSKSICSEPEQRELEAIVREHSGVKKTYLLEQKIIDLYREIDYIKKDKDDLQTQMEQMALDYEIIKQENQDLSFKLERSQLQEECISYTTIDELETEIESLENDLESKSKELSKSNLVIKELESHIKNLEQELENQGHEYETDLKELMLAKTIQEQRAVHAEDNLRKIRLQNVNAASRLQEELKRLSQKMASTFDVNEKATMEAMDEANKIRVEKQVLEDTLMKVKKDIKVLGDCFQEKLVFIEDQVTLKSKQLREIKEKIENVTEIHNLETQRLKEKDVQLEVEKLGRKSDVRLQKTEKSQ
ncbi:putative NT-type C2 domain-containing protein [Helianthus annuus]|uniref:NT-type C2 domain-containing protein n=1 Tax=Helianthus annuus TaxID=4232 RepID=A0A9K3HDB9_HELAN|nr:myosin-11-like [Helianthus annuus]KAF5774836.1 putative NT-type C2 domain-containing protein [Helianthus annuus]KAJ0478090.1 putative NT-type C2 domain-containing protein [Helianthus annuus]KAJ0482746.1 putative NT-type C2 domain-containing protein [Helianthus annuus]KAJ0498969.1 putative NT-type C2 domain-containing protein [Helianthus annuus]KAJ0664984.1 putative NT-type C2 domain-containing protein [Helianthus annuus]